MDPSKVQLYEPVADSDDANAHPVSGADEYIVHITFELQTANTARDSGQSASLLVDLLRHAPAISQQGPDLQKVLQLIQVTAQALPCCRSNSQAQQTGCQALRTLGEAADGLQQADTDQVQKEALDAVAQSMLAFPQDSSLQNHGVAAMLALSGCNMRSVARGVYDVNSTDKQGCTVLHKLAMFGLSDCLSVIIKACGTHLDFRHKCDGGKTAVMAAELNQHQACVDILNRAAQGSPDMLFQQPSSSASLQQAQTAAGSHLASFPLSQQLLQLNVSRARQQQQQQQLQQLQQQQQLQLQQQQQHLLQHQQQQQEASGVMPGLYPLLSNMQGHTDAMLQLTMQAASLYPFQRLTPVLSAPALSRPGPGGVPPAPSRPGPSLDATPFSAASQRTSTESAYTTGRPSLDDASMLSRIYPSSSLDSSVSQHRMSIEDSNRRLSLSSRPSSTWSAYHGLNTHFQASSPWPSRLARAFSDEPGQSSGRPSRESVGRMSVDEPQSAVSASSAMPHHLSGPIMEEEVTPEDNTEEEEKQEPSWSSTAETDWAEAVAAAAAAQPGTSGAAGQGGDQAWNWPWGSAQHALQGGFLDPDALLDDESEGASKHLWLGNLNTRLPRAVLKAVFEQHGPVDDVVTFPGRMYAFVNFQHADDAARAQESLDGKEVASLSGGRRLTVRFRPSKRALGKLNEGHPDARDSPAMPQLKEFEGAQAEAGLLHGTRAGEWEGSSIPSNRVWLGNISATATLRSVRSVFSKFGPLTDAAVFPARIGPLGYAFVNFEKVADAAGAYHALNNVVLPALTGCKQLKMRFKPAKGNSSDMLRGDSSSLEADWEGSLLEASQPSRHLLLGNIATRPNESAIETVFGKFGPLEAVKVFPGKTYALVSFKDLAPAAEAMQCLDGHSLLSVSGQKPLVIRYQTGSGAQPSTASSAEAAPTSPSTATAPPPPPSNASAASAPAADPAARASSTSTGQPRSARTLFSGDEEESDDDSLMPAVNLSNRLNPNNVHFDRQLAAQYKRMSKHEKEALWAADRARQHELRELTELSQMAGLTATELTQLTELTQAAMLNQPASDASANLLSQLGPFFPKPGQGLPPAAAPWEGSLPPTGPAGAFPNSPALPPAGLNDAALTGAASGLQAAAQSLLRQRMEALRQQGAGLRGFVGPPPLGHPESGDPSQHHMPGMPLGNPPPPPYWPQLQGQSSMHAMPPQPANTAYLPQHLAQRSQSHPSFGLPPGPYAAYHQRQQQQPPAFGLHSQPQQELQALEAQAQAQLHQAHENQARLAADQQLQAHQQAAGQAQQSGEALRDRAPGQSSIGGAFHPARWPSPGASDQHSVTQQASDQQRRFAELLASRHLQQNDPGLHRQFSGVQQPPGLPSQQFRNQIAEGTNPLLQEQAHRLASRGAVSTPEQMYHLNSLAGGPGAEQAYRLASLGSASPGEALAPLHDVGNQGQLYASAQADLSSNPAYSVNQFAQHIAAPATSAPASQGPA